MIEPQSWKMIDEIIRNLTVWTIKIALGNHFWNLNISEFNLWYLADLYLNFQPADLNFKKNVAII